MNFKFIDMHCDTLIKSLSDGKLYDNPENMLDVKRMTEAGQGAQFFAVFFPPETDGIFPPDDELYSRAVEVLTETAAKHSDVFKIAYQTGDIAQNMKDGVVSAVLTIEDARAVDGKMENLAKFHGDGVRAMSLTWNSENCFGYPNSSDSKIMAEGLKPFGREAVREMNRLGVIIDVSHLSDGGFWDVVEISEKPLAATHSNCRQLCSHVRNLSDEMIRAIAGKGGVIGVNFAPQFLSDGGGKDSRCEDIARHVKHMMKTGGEDVAALGSDFDGIDGSFEIGEPGDMLKLFDMLAKMEVSERVIEKIAFGNVLRFLGDTLV